MVTIQLGGTFLNEFILESAGYVSYFLHALLQKREKRYESVRKNLHKIAMKK